MKRAIIFAHFDRDGVIDPWVTYALGKYRRHCERIILVSAGSRGQPIPEVVDEFVARPNTGYDFGSWRDGLRLLPDLANYEEILFVNDSAYGPLFDLDLSLDHPKHCGATVWGGVVSNQITPHLQSWFFAVRRPMLERSEFLEFWEGVRHHEHKRDVIWNYELGFSRLASRLGFRPTGLYEDPPDSAPTVWERVRNWDLRNPCRSFRHWRRVRPCKRPLNPSELYWDRLWDAGVPFLKAGIFRVNPYAISKRRVFADLRARFPEWEPLIRAHLARIQPEALRGTGVNGKG
jgi:Rhamnan synthesis protein F